MQIPPIEGKPPRFYHIHLQEDLLEGWTLIRESGQQGASGRVTRQHYEQYDEALQALMKMRDQQLQRGYQIVFAMGETG
jgi:predicted DNA-binding WGR domain protein